MDYDKMTKAITDAAMVHKREEFQAHLDVACQDAIAQCESPIEFAFLSALLIHGIEHMVDVSVFFNAEQQWRTVWECGALVTGSLYRLRITPQWRHERKRIDFHLEYGDRIDYASEHDTYWTSVLLVECDGHDYHERTKEQAQKDKSRDRELTAAGFPIFRFTGSEIFKDAKACAASCIRHLRAASHKLREGGKK